MKRNSLLVMKQAEVIDHIATGLAVRQARTARACSQNSLAGAMKITPSYLSDLEKGKRNWNEKLVNAVEEAL